MPHSIPATAEKYDKSRHYNLTGIYLYVNRETSQYYIGKTQQSFGVRFYSHRRGCTQLHNKFAQALAKFGVQAFDQYILEVIDKQESDATFFEREAYWIIQCNLTENDYNMISVPNLHLPKFKMSDELVRNIIHSLETEDVPLSTIADEWQVSIPSVSRIKNGLEHPFDDITYPIRTPKVRRQYQRDAQILGTLMNTDLSFKQICQKYKCTRQYLRRLNDGDIPEDEKQYLYQEFEDIHLRFPICTPEQIDARKVLAQKLQRQQTLSLQSHNRCCTQSQNVQSLLPNIKRPNQTELLAHLKSGLALSAIARIYDVTPAAVVKWCRAYHYPSSQRFLNLLNTSDWEACSLEDLLLAERNFKFMRSIQYSDTELLEWYESGKTIQEIHSITGWDVEKISIILKQYGYDPWTVWKQRQRQKSPAVYCPTLDIQFDNVHEAAIYLNREFIHDTVSLQKIRCGIWRCINNVYPAYRGFVFYKIDS